MKGWSVDAETIRRPCHAEATACRKTKCDRIAAPADFAKAPGDRGLQIDAGRVNTGTGGRDVTLATFAAREPADPCTSEDFDDRDLPRPSVRHVIAAIEPVEEFGPRCKAEAEKLGLTGPWKRTVPGDGAARIWDLAEEHFAGAEQALDPYHATRYLADLSRAGFGEDAAAADEWRHRARRALVADGGAGAWEFGEQTEAELSDPAALGTAFPRVADYLSGPQDGMLYAARLRRGASVGGGMIEGAIPQHVGRRIEQTGARWKTEDIGPLVELIRIGQTDDWETYWSAA